MKNTTPKIEAGTGATQAVGSDCYPFTVVEQLSPKKIVLQRDDAVMAPEGNYFGDQVWNITRNPNGGMVVATLRKNGRWVPEGQPMNSSGGFRLGVRRKYLDPHF